MRVEAFSRGKSFARPQDNEDAFLVLPGLGYAVVDGVTDRSGQMFGAMRGGRFAAGVVIGAVAEGLARGDSSADRGAAWSNRLLALIDDRLREGYAAHGRLEAAATNADARAGATLALVWHDGDMVRLAAIGDTGVRIGGPAGARLHLDCKPLDRITALMRRETWRHLSARGVAGEARSAIATAVVGRGLAVAPEGLTAAEAAALAARVATLCAQETPTIAAADIAVMIAGGVSAQRRFANRDADGLAYGVIDGFGVPARHVARAEWPREAVERIEIFSDGYFDVAAGAGVAAWEARFAEIEALDPDKIGAFASMKGSGPDNWTDDRTYVCIDLADHEPAGTSN